MVERRGSVAFSNFVDVLSQSDTHRHLSNLLSKGGAGIGLTDAKYGKYVGVSIVCHTALSSHSVWSLQCRVRHTVNYPCLTIQSRISNVE